LNEAALVAHWDGQISGVELARRLQRLRRAAVSEYSDDMI
jgi:hypothetical protein